MPFAEFAPSNLGDTGSVLDNGNAFASMIQRAQQVAQSKAAFPLLQQKLAGEIVLNSQSQEMNNLAISKQLQQAALIPSDLARQRADNDASVAADATNIAISHANALLSQQMTQDFPNVMGKLNSITGTGPSTAPVNPDSDDVQDPAQQDQVAAARSSRGLPPPAGTPSSAASQGPGINYSSVADAQTAYNVFKARYGNLPAASGFIGQLDGKLAAVSAAYNGQLYAKLPSYGAAIRGAKTTDDLLAVGSDPDFDHATALPGDAGQQLAKNYDDKFKLLDAKEQQARQIAAEQANQARQQQAEATKQKAEFDRKVEQENTIDPTTGFKGIARGTPAEASAFRDAAVQTQTANDALTQLQGLAQKLGNNPLTKLTDPVDQAKATSLATQIKGALREPFFGGKLTDQDNAILDKIIPNPGHVFTLESSTLAKIKSLIDTNSAKLALKAKALNLQPAAPADAPATDADSAVKANF